VALSKDGSRAFVTARGADSLMVFDTAKLVTDSGHALMGSAIAGKSPVGVAVAGQYVVTANSNRFAQAGRKGEWLSVIDPVTFKVIGNVAAGLFPRELYVTDDGKTLLVTNFNSNSLGLVDLAGLTPAYFVQQKLVKDADDAQQTSAQAALAQRVKNQTPDPAREAPLRRFIEAVVKGSPAFEIMSTGLANAVRQQQAATEPMFQKAGALKSITFKSVGPGGMDIYTVTFEHANQEWRIGPLDPDGKINAINFGPAP
jgi:DNA-binding beta-propeller fold protein YncE